MLSSSNISVVETLRLFKAKGVGVTFLVPTETGLKKSIMDATRTVREYLQKNKIHDFEKQPQGTDNKILISTKLVSKGLVVDTKTSLYRPKTKNGDPRIWIYKLAEYSESGDLLAITMNKSHLTVINCSKTNLDELLDDKNKYFLELFSIADSDLSNEANELLTMIKSVAAKGYIKTLKSGATGVGFTLETLLGIEANSSRAPDYKGIEIKSNRKRNAKGTLLSMVPNWKLSNINSADELVNKRGRSNPDWGGLKTLHHTIMGNSVNSLGLRLSLDDQHIYQSYENNGIIENDVCWLLTDLEDRLSKKHKETFWVEVETEGDKDNERFHYKKVIHTGDIDTSIIPALIENGIISIDYLLWERSKGWKKFTSKTGFDFLWKIKNKNRDLLFKFIKTYEI